MLYLASWDAELLGSRSADMGYGILSYKFNVA